MDIFAGNFSVSEKIEFPDIDFDLLQTGEKSYFIMWADEWVTNIIELQAFLTSIFWRLESIDISIESNDRLEVISSEYETGDYECVSFEGPQVDFSDILERFSDSMEAVCIRECERSKLYGNNIVRVDFIY